MPDLSNMMQYGGLVPGLQERLNGSKSWRDSQDKQYTDFLQERQNQLQMMLMTQQHPQQQRGLYDIYRWIQRQKMDAELNNAQFSRAMEENKLRMKEYQRLFGQPYQSNMPPGRWM